MPRSCKPRISAAAIAPTTSGIRGETAVERADGRIRRVNVDVDDRCQIEVVSRPRGAWRRCHGRMLAPSLDRRCDRSTPRSWSRGTRPPGRVGRPCRPPDRTATRTGCEAWARMDAVRRANCSGEVMFRAFRVVWSRSKRMTPPSPAARAWETGSSSWMDDPGTRPSPSGPPSPRGRDGPSRVRSTRRRTSRSSSDSATRSAHGWRMDRRTATAASANVTATARRTRRHRPRRRRPDRPGRFGDRVAARSAPTQSSGDRGIAMARSRRVGRDQARVPTAPSPPPRHRAVRTRGRRGPSLRRIASAVRPVGLTDLTGCHIHRGQDAPRR